MDLQTATAQDVDGIARLHTDSWRRNYRGALTDEFLDGDLLANRRTEWAKRVAASPERRCTIVAADNSEVIGFAHTFLDEHATWGALLDNLHVVHALKGRGIGTLLMAETARRVLEARPSSSLYLWVLQQNTAAQEFYRARRGVFHAPEETEPEGGGRTFRIRVTWADPAVLLVGAAG